jgi:hypothetical protein
VGVVDPGRNAFEPLSLYCRITRRELVRIPNVDNTATVDENGAGTPTLCHRPTLTNEEHDRECSCAETGTYAKGA